MAIGRIDLLGRLFASSAPEEARRAVLSLVAAEMIPKIRRECRAGSLRECGIGPAISAFGIVLRRGVESWDSRESRLDTWLVLLTSQECSKWRERKDKANHPATASNQPLVVAEDSGEEVGDRFDEAPHADLSPFALDSVIEQCDAQEDETGMLMQAYALCYRDGVTSEIANLSARSGLSFARISAICRSGELARRIRAITL